MNWILATLIAAAAQTARNAMQCGLAASLGVLGDALTPLRTLAILIATIGVALTAVKPGERWWKAATRPAPLAIAAGACFALTAVGFRGGVLALGNEHYWLRASTTLAWSLGLQALLLGAWISAFVRGPLLASFGLWRQSVVAGFFLAHWPRSSGFWVSRSRPQPMCAHWDCSWQWRHMCQGSLAHG